MSEKQLLAGYGRRCITPKISVPLAGYGATWKRMSERIMDDLYATCIAFTSGDKTVLLFTQDLISTIPGWIQDIRARLVPKTGIPAENILACSTHTHSAPDIISDLDCMKEYYADYLDAVEEAALEALEDRAPAKLFATRLNVDMNRVRHYILENGTYAGSNLGDFNSAPIAGHAEPNDPDMILLKAEREEKPGILLINYQVHPTSASNIDYRAVSADFISYLRMNVEDVTGMHVAYFTGAAGNQVQSSRIPEERGFMSTTGFYKYGDGHSLVYGWRMAQQIYPALKTLKPIEGEGIEVLQVPFEWAVNHAEEDLVDIAQDVVEYCEEHGNAAGHERAHELGLKSAFHARAIMRRVSRPKTQTMELTVMRIGPFALATLPYEAFSSHGIFIKEKSPFPVTLVFSCTNGAWTYVPTIKAFDYQCYEGCTSYFERGVGEAVAEKLVEMLKTVK